MQEAQRECAELLPVEGEVWGMDLKEAQRLKDLEKENGELKKMLADQMLKARALEIALEKNI